jgi:hypothetical protein
MFAFLRSRRSSSSLDAAALAALADACDEARLTADAALTPERAEAQRDAILARLRTAGAADEGRVLAFPPREAEVETVRRPAPAGVFGWALTAAAAGIVVGAGAGTGTYPELTPASAAVTAAPAAVDRVAVPVAMPEPDDEVLAALAATLSTRGVEELRPLDALTPRVTLVAAR